MPGSDRAGRYVVLDVLTDRPLEGNALAVFTEGADLEVDRMQKLAREMNLSETVFLVPPKAGGDARIRIFTPTTELPSPAIPCSVRRSWSATNSVARRSAWRPQPESCPSS